MLFNSYAFIFLFLPVVFIGMFWIGRYSNQLAALWLALASLTFYAVWDPRFVILLLASIAFNYSMGFSIGQQKVKGNDKHAKYILTTAIIINLLLLAYFKYANFFLDSANHLFDSRFPALNIILPLGISFFTFTQITFLVDVYKGIVREYNFVHYLLFVTYFPHLIAGPVLHHKQMIPQFVKPETYQINWSNVAVGVSIFVLGLGKKVLLADNFAEYASPIFNLLNNGAAPMLIEAWVGILSYTLQLYFDFSGYSDMAVGLSLMLNVHLPINFDSPYKATSVIEFWRRWHMTLSAFLRDYLYIPLGGNRKGVFRRYVNLLVTMLLGGLWHGAGWTYVIWGGLHGFYLIVNHVWREVKQKFSINDSGHIAQLFAGVLTFLAVMIAWVFFRAGSFSAASTMLSGMAGVNGISLPLGLKDHLPSDLLMFHLEFNGIMPLIEITGEKALFDITLGLIIVWFFPNVRQMLVAYKPTWEDIANKPTPATLPKNFLARKLSWQPGALQAWLIGTVFVLCIFSLTKVSEFLYFQF